MDEARPDQRNMDDDSFLVDKSIIESMSDNNHFLNILFDNHPDYIYFKNQDSKFIKINKKTAEALGLDHPDEAIGKSDFDFFPEVAEKNRADELAILETGKPRLNVEVELLFADGKKHWISDSKVPFYDQQGNVQGIVGISRDITDLKRKDFRIKTIEETARALMKTQVDVLAFINQDGMIIDLNEATAKRLGKTIDELKGDIIWNYFPYDIAENRKEKVKQAIETKQTVSFVDKREDYWNENILTPIDNDDHETPSMVLVIAKDITEKKKYLDKLTNSEVSYRTIFNNSTDTIFIHDFKTGKIIDVNQTTLNKLGYTKDEILQMNVGDFSINEPPYTQKEAVEWIHKAANEGPQTFEWIVKNKYGKLIWFENILRLVEISGEKRVLVIGRDITSRKKIEEELKKSEKKFRLISDYTYDWEIYKNERGKVVYSNKAFDRIFGYKNEDFLSGKITFDDLFFKEDVDTVEKIFSDIKEGNIINDVETRARKNDGSEIFISISSVPVTVENKFLGVRTSIRDINSRKKTEQTLKESEERYKRLVEKSPGITYIYGTKSGSLFCSKRVKDVLGLTTDQLKHDPFLWMNSIHPDDLPSVRKIFEAEETNDNFDIEYRVKDVNGIWHWLRDFCISIKEENDERIIEGLAIDVTERKNAEEKLVESEKKLQLKLKSVLSPDMKLSTEDFANIINTDQLQTLMEDFYKLTNIGIGVLDMNGKILVATGWQDICTKFHRVHPETNKNCIESDIYLSEHVKPGEFVKYKCKNNMWDMATPIVLGGKRLGTIFLGQFFFDDEEIDRSFYEKQADQYGFDKKAYLDALDRVPRWNEETVYTVMNFYSKFSEMVSQLSYSNVKLAKMVEQQKQSEEELQKAHQELKDMNKNLEDIVLQRTEELSKAIKLKDEFIHQLGHDLKTPLGPLVSLLPIIKKHADDPKDKEMLTVIQRNVSFMKNLVKKTLELAQLNSPNTSFDFELFPLKELIFEVKGKNISYFVDNNVTLENNISEDVVVYADELQLFEVFDNLFHNSIKYGRDDIHIKLNAEKQDDEVIISIQDNGVGMTPDQLDHIFDEFYKVDGSRHDFDSSGLGLPICKRIIEKHGGKIWVESEGPNQGSTFYFSLPAHS